MTYKIDLNKCVDCGGCMGVCPVAAIAHAECKYQINPDLCASCGCCAGICPVGAIAIDTPEIKKD
ncbi:MAG: 4Fe-4S binding protein [Alphaproteobacteria bacterium]|nr:4Fe-4S binding protein [Alphaproteobacteria bacterium]